MDQTKLRENLLQNIPPSPGRMQARGYSMRHCEQDPGTGSLLKLTK